MFRLLFSLLSLTLLMGAASHAQTEDAPTTTMFVVDGSGSMWGNLAAEKRPKLEVMRDALRALLPSVRPAARVGIAAFGHRRRGNCGDVEVIAPPETGAAERLTFPVDRLNAVGKGPISLALREAASAIAGATPANIVVIADDVDNCGQDICGAMQDVLAQSPGLVVHTIALDFDPTKIKQISCLAQLTGGKLWNAQDAAGLTSALEQAAELAFLKAPPTPAAPEIAAGKAPPTPASAPPGLYLSVGLGQNSGTLESPVHWRIKRGDEVIREERAPTVTAQVEPGTYRVEARLGLAHVEETVEVAADTPTPVRLNLDGGVLRLQAQQTQASPALPSATFTVAPANPDDADRPDAPLWIGRDAQPEIVLPAGDYVVTAEHGLVRQSDKVTINAATGTNFSALMSSGVVELSAAHGTEADPGEPVVDGITYIIYRDDPDAPQGRREVTRSAAPNPQFTLPAGTYYVTARTASSEVRDQIALGAGDVVKRVMPLSLARVKLSATLGGQQPGADTPITFSVVSLDGEPREVARSSEREPEFEIGAGRYRLQASLGGSNVVGATEIVLRPQQAQKVALRLDGGSITLKQAAGSILPGDLFWEVRDEQQRTVLRTSQAEPTAILAPGRYLVSVETGAEPLRNAIDVKGNEHRTFEFTAP
jgi:Ca-activated chloride channel family protein